MSHLRVNTVKMRGRFVSQIPKEMAIVDATSERASSSILFVLLLSRVVAARNDLLSSATELTVTLCKDTLHDNHVN
jgi:hypothetical protein